MCVPEHMFSSPGPLFIPTALLFSATFRKKIERLARDILVDPIRVVQGDIGEVIHLKFILALSGCLSNGPSEVAALLGDHERR